MHFGDSFALWIGRMIDRHVTKVSPICVLYDRLCTILRCLFGSFASPFRLATFELGQYRFLMLCLSIVKDLDTIGQSIGYYEIVGKYSFRCYLVRTDRDDPLHYYKHIKASSIQMCLTLIKHNFISRTNSGKLIGNYCEETSTCSAFSRLLSTSMLKARLWWMRWFNFHLFHPLKRNRIKNGFSMRFASTQTPATAEMWLLNPIVPQRLYLPTHKSFWWIINIINHD